MEQNERERAQRRLGLLEKVLAATEDPVAVMTALLDCGSRQEAAERLSPMVSGDSAAVDYILDMRFVALMPFGRDDLVADAKSIRALLADD